VERFGEFDNDFKGFSFLPSPPQTKSPNPTNTLEIEALNEGPRRNACGGHLRKILYCALLNGAERDCVYLTANLNRIRIGCSSRSKLFSIMPDIDHHPQKATERLEVKHYCRFLFVVLSYLS